MDGELNDKYGKVKLSKEQKRSRNRRLLAYGIRAKKPLLIGFLLTGLAVVFDLLGPFMIGRIVDREIKEGVGVESWGTLWLLLGFYFICIIMASVMRLLANYNLQSAANRISQYMQIDVFDHVHRLPISYFDSLPAGTVVSRVTNDTSAVRNLFVVVLSQLMTAAAYAIGIFISLILLDVSLFWISITSLPLVVLIVWDFRRKSSYYNRKSRKNLSELNGSLNENIQGMEVIQALGQEKRIEDEFNDVNNRLYKVNLKLTKLYAYSSYNATGTLQYLMLGAVLLYFGIGSLTGSYLVPIGNLYIFIDYMTKLFNQVNNAMNRIGELERSLSAADHVFELLEEKTERDSGEPVSALQGNVRFEHVSFAYKDETVLKDVSFEVKAGETIAFVGATGSGKSTIMNLLLGFYPIERGEIYLDGKPISSLRNRDFRKSMAIVQQEPYLFTGTVLSNISLNQPGLTQEKALTALFEVGGEPLYQRLPDGLLSQVKEKGNEFSAGERQLISFARALAKDPKILVLDEATASIDSETEAAIQKGITRLKEGRTTFMIAHRLSTIRHADQIVVLERGRIIERGSHDELIALNGTYRHMYESQSSQGNGNGV